MSVTREPLEWHFKQLDHAVGLSFKSNFHFALVGHLIKGYRHPTPTTVSRTSRVLTMLLGIVAKPMQRDKFEVSTDSVAYLTGTLDFINNQISISVWKYFISKCIVYAALVAVSEEVRSRCHVKHTLPRWPVETNTNNELISETQNMANQPVSRIFRFSVSKLIVTFIPTPPFCSKKFNSNYYQNNVWPLYWCGTWQWVIQMFRVPFHHNPYPSIEIPAIHPLKKIIMKRFVIVWIDIFRIT